MTLQAEQGYAFTAADYGLTAALVPLSEGGLWRALLLADLVPDDGLVDGRGRPIDGPRARVDFRWYTDSTPQARRRQHVQLPRQAARAGLRRARGVSAQVRAALATSAPQGGRRGVLAEALGLAVGRWGVVELDEPLDPNDGGSWGVHLRGPQRLPNSPSLRSSASGDVGSNPTFSFPSGMASGDVLLHLYGLRTPGATDSTTSDEPTLTTTDASSVSKAELWTIDQATGTEGSTWSATQSDLGSYLAGAYQDAAGISQVATDTGSTNPVSAPSISIAAGGLAVALMLGRDNGGSFSTGTLSPGTWSADAEHAPTATRSGLLHATRAFASASASGTPSCNYSSSSEWVGIMVELEKAPDPISVTPTPATVALTAPSATTTVAPAVQTPTPATATLTAPSVGTSTGPIVRPDPAVVALAAPEVGIIQPPAPQWVFPTTTAVALTAPTPAFVGPDIQVHSVPTVEVAWGVPATREPRDKRVAAVANYPRTAQVASVLQARTATNVANFADVAGDLDIRADLGAPADTWQQLVNTATERQWPVVVSAGGTSSANARQYQLRLTADGKLRLSWSTDGTVANTSTVTCDTALPWVGADPPALGYVRRWVRATLDVDNGASGHDVRFYWSTDGTTWTQVGSTDTTAGTTSIHSADADAFVGGGWDPASGVDYAVIQPLDFYQVRVLDDGVAVLNVTVADMADGLDSLDTHTDSPGTGVVWTLRYANNYDENGTFGSTSVLLPSEWVDVTPAVYANEGASIDIVGGRARLLDVPQPATWTLPLFDPDRAYEPDVAAVDVRPSTHVRVREAYGGIAYPVARGFITDVLPSWPDTGDLAVARFPCSDGTRQLQLRGVVGSLDDLVGTSVPTPAAWWKLDEASGTLADSSGNGNDLSASTWAYRDAIWTAGGGGTDYAIGSPSSGTAIQSTVASPSAELDALAGSAATVCWWSYVGLNRATANNWQWGLNAVPAAGTPDIFGFTHFYAGLTTDAAQTFSEIGTQQVDPLPVRNRWVHMAYVRQADGTRRLYIDGTERGRVDGDPYVGAAETVNSVVLEYLAASGAEAGNAMAHLMVWAEALTPAQVRVMAKANLGTLAAERTDQRIGRILDWAGWPTDRRQLDTGMVTLAEVTPLAGETALGLIQDCVAAEGVNAWAYVDREGVFQFRSRVGRMALDPEANGLLFTDDVLADTGLPYRQPVPASGERTLRTVVRSKTATTEAVAGSQEGAEVHGDRLAELGTVATSTAAQLEAVVADAAARLGTPRAYLRQISTSPHLDTDMGAWLQLLNATFGTRCVVEYLPPDRSGGTSRRTFVGYVEGVRQVLGHRTREMVLQLAPAHQVGTWVLGQSRIGFDTVLGIPGDTV